MGPKETLQAIIDDGGACRRANICANCPFNLKNNNVSCFISIIGDTFIEGNFNEKYLKAAQRKLVEISLEEALND